jgi:hypothetical protein
MKENLIQKIKQVIGDWGSVNSVELISMGSQSNSICINSIGNVFQLIESFNYDDVTTITYHDEVALQEMYIPYEDLNEDVLQEISEVMDEYDHYMKKTMDKCKDENF